MAKKIFVGNLSFQTSETDLNDLFAPFGEVESVSIITDRDTGRSKGFGFVAMGDDSAIQANPHHPVCIERGKHYISITQN